MTNYNNFNQCFINCLAPSLCGIKPANLFTVSISDFSQEEFIKWKNLLAGQNLGLVNFKSSDSRIMVIAFNLLWIRKILGDSLIQTYLRGKGYENPSDTAKTLDELFQRLKTQKGFPHEVGLILGYPFEDVVGFEENQGRNCKCCSYWKSYSDPSVAKKCCSEYKQCSKLCKQWFEEGHTVPQIIQKYKEAVCNAA